MRQTRTISILLSFALPLLAGCGSSDAEHGEPDQTDDPVQIPTAGDRTAADGGSNDDMASDGGGPTDAGHDRPDDDDRSPDGATPDTDSSDMSTPDDENPSPEDMSATTRTPLRTSWPHGLEWVRNNPTFVSGLVVQFPPVDAGFVNAYYDDFNANTIHLWETGLPDRINQWLGVPRNDHRWLSWVHADGTSFINGEVAGGVPPGLTGRIGYQVGDEPRTWAQYQEQLTGVTAIRNHDPGALVFLNMSYLAEELDRMMADICTNDDIDVISHDWYSTAQNQYEKLEYFRDWALQCDKPYWRYLHSYYETGSGFDLSESDMRWHALVGLVYGYTGHSWFIYQVGGSNTSHTVRSGLFQTAGSTTSFRTSSYDIAARLNTELRNYGRVISRLTSTDVRYQTELGALAQPELTSPWEVGAGNDPYLTDFEVDGASFQEGVIGFFEDNYGERYVMFQNPNHDDGSFPVNNESAATFTLTFDFSAAPTGFDTTAVEHFDGRTANVSDVPLTQNELTVTLTAGDVYLFKYATGHPWEIQ